MAQLELLKTGLREFGLDPKDWDLDIKLQLDNLLKIEVKPATGDEPVFEGWAESSHWRSLALHG